MPYEDFREKLVSRSVDLLIGLLKKYDVVIVVPPSPVRREVADRARGRYPGPGRLLVLELGGRAEGGEGPVERAVNEVGGRGKGDKVVVLPGDTCTASKIAEALRGNERTRSAGVCLLNLGGVARDLASTMSSGRDLERLRSSYKSSKAKERLDRARVKVEPGYEGVYLAPLIGGDPEAVAKIGRLAPGASSFLQSFVESFRRRFPEFSIEALVDLFSELAGVGPAAKAVKSLMGFAVVFMGVRGREEEFASSFVELVIKARRVSMYLGDETYEDVFDCIATQWDLTLEEFSYLVRSLRGMLTGRDPSELRDDVIRGIKERARELEERLRKLEVESKAAKALLGVYRDIESFPYIRFESGRFSIRVAGETWGLATTADYERLSERLSKELTERGLVVLKGTSGSGKSTLVYYTAARMLLESRDRGAGFAVYVVNDLSDYSSRFQIDSFLEVARESSEGPPGLRPGASRGLHRDRAPGHR